MSDNQKGDEVENLIEGIEENIKESLDKNIDPNDMQINKPITSENQNKQINNNQKNENEGNINNEIEENINIEHNNNENLNLNNNEEKVEVVDRGINTDELPPEELQRLVDNNQELIEAKEEEYSKEVQEEKFVFKKN